MLEPGWRCAVSPNRKGLFSAEENRLATISLITHESSRTISKLTESSPMTSQTNSCSSKLSEVKSFKGSSPRGIIRQQHKMLR